MSDARQTPERETPARPAPDYRAITEGHRDVWANGDFNHIARLNVGMAEVLTEAADPRPTDRVMDLGCGSGTAALVVARRYCDVTGVDLVPELIERARARAAASGLDAEFQVGDAQDLPFADDSFDQILSVYGVQFAPDQEKAAGEMFRVCRPGGHIGLASPIPEGWSGDFFALNGKYAPPPPGIQSPLRWGTDEGLEELLGAGVSSIRSETRTALQHYRSLDHAVSVFTTYFGPVVRTTRTLAEDEAKTFHEEIRNVFATYNRATDGTAVVENRYRLTVATCA